MGSGWNGWRSTSPRQFQQHDIVTTVCAALLDSGLDPGCLELEITESAVMYDSEQTAEALQYFREMGVRIAIDDFGTGYSSLSQLKKYPITLLKIDRSFVSGIGHGGDDDAIVDAVIAIARKLGLRCWPKGSRRHSSGRSCAPASVTSCRASCSAVPGAGAVRRVPGKTAVDRLIPSKSPASAGSVKK